MLVTGGGTGIGRAAALAFAREGAKLVLAGRRRAEIEAVAQEIVVSGGEAVAVVTDVREEPSVEALIVAAMEAFGRLDVAFNNAGLNSYAPIEQLSAAEFDNVLATNARGVWLLMKAEIAAMRTAGRGGAIVNTSSIAATGGTAGLSIYAASKGALDAMIRPLALEVGADGIRINNVSPGVTLTEMVPAEMLAPIARHTALKRNGETQDVASAVLWLASPLAGFVTGQSILVDGGFNIAGAR